MRQGERLGLTWDRVDLDAGTLTVDRQLVEMTAAEDVSGTDGVVYERLVDGYYLGPTKTKAGACVLPLVPWMAALTAWRDQCPTSPYGLMWSRPDGGPWSKKDDRLAWLALQDVAGVHKEDGGTISSTRPVARRRRSSWPWACPPPSSSPSWVTPPSPRPWATSTPTWNRPAKLSKPSHPASA